MLSTTDTFEYQSFLLAIPYRRDSRGLTHFGFQYTTVGIREDSAVSSFSTLRTCEHSVYVPDDSFSYPRDSVLPEDSDSRVNGWLLMTRALDSDKQPLHHGLCMYWVCIYRYNSGISRLTGADNRQGKKQQKNYQLKLTTGQQTVDRRLFLLVLWLPLGLFGIRRARPEKQGKQGKTCITGDHSIQDPRYTHKDLPGIYLPIFPNNIWCCLLRTRVTFERRTR